MGLTTLGQSGAMNTGAQIWVVPNLDNSWWARKIDWYLGFQIARAQTHRPATYSAELRDILTNWEVPSPNCVLPGPVSPLLIACEESLPARQLVMLPFAPGHERSHEEWFQDIQTHLARLRAQRVRIFLPTNLPVEQALTLCDSQAMDFDISFVAEPSQL